MAGGWLFRGEYTQDHMGIHYNHHSRVKYIMVLFIHAISLLVFDTSVLSACSSSHINPFIYILTSCVLSYGNN